MNRTALFTALVALIASSARCLAQASSSLPVILPIITELGVFRDTTLNGSLMPQEAALSPRGTLIAYTTWDDLRIWNASTHSDRVVVNGDCEGIVWSPTGDAIAFRRWGEGNSPEKVWVLRLNPVSGVSIGSPQQVSVMRAADVAPQFSPDGRSIAFVGRDSVKHVSLVVVPVAVGTERVLVSGFGISSLRWAVDGNAIYYASYQDSAQTKAVLQKVAVNGGAPRLVHEFAGESVAPALSADNRVVTLSPEAVSGGHTVSIRELTGRGLATMSIPAGVSVDDLSGEYRLVGVRETHPRGLRIINIADGKSRVLIDSTADVQAVAWFADNRRIAAIVFYDATGMLVTVNADGSGMRKTPLATQPARSPNLFAPPVENFRVSSDGRYAVYLGGPRVGALGGRSLDLVDLSTGEQRTLTRARAVMTPFWHRDSKTIRYMRIAESATTDPHWPSVHDVSLDGTDTLVRSFPISQYPNATVLLGENYVSNFNNDKYTLARLDGSPDQVLLRGRIPSPGAITSDGRTIVVSAGTSESDHKARKIILLSVPDGTQRTVDLPLAEAGCGPFSPDGRYVYCKGREEDASPQTLYEVPVDGSTPRLVARSDSREVRGAIALSPDGRWMLETVAGVRRAAFVSLDFTDDMTRLLRSSAKP
jgi:Tol biopolymer transport system component